jgi:CDP-glucose 4,6-dehydratase
LWGSKIKIIESEISSYYESEKLRLDSSKAQEDLGWTSKLNIDQTLKKIVEWEKKETLSDIEEITLSQIDKYFEN